MDWQLSSVGNPLIDVATLFASGPVRRLDLKFTQSMVKYYHGCLAEFGVADLDWETCWLYFRWGFFRLHLWVLPVGVVKADERKTDLSTVGVTQGYAKQYGP